MSRGTITTALFSGLLFGRFFGLLLGQSSRLKIGLLVGLSSGLLAPSPASAYLDPGTGSAVLQMVVAGVMGALFVLKMYWRKLVTLFGGGDPESDGDAGEARNGKRAASDASVTRDERN